MKRLDPAPRAGSPDRRGQAAMPARSIAGQLGGTLAGCGRAYVAGLLEIGCTLAGFGREILAEAGGHVRATAQATSLREAAELQAAWAQHQLEMAATRGRELADLARTKSEAVIGPIPLEF